MQKLVAFSVFVPINGMSRSFGFGETVTMKKPSQHLIAEVPRRPVRVEMTIGIDLGDVWSHYCTLNEKGEAVDRGRFRTSPKGVEKWFTDLPPARVAMEAGTHSIWISEQLQELGHEVIVANVRELRAISHSDRPLFESFFTGSLVLVSSEPLGDRARVKAHTCADAE
jgi:hypothetical protein